MHDLIARDRSLGGDLIYFCTKVFHSMAATDMVVVREILFPLQNYNVVALTYIAAKTNIVWPISVTRSRRQANDRIFKNGIKRVGR